MRVPLVDLAWQHDQIADEIAVGLKEVMDSTAFIHGPAVAAFESEFADFCGVGHCVGVGNGTDALELAVRALGIGPGNQVIVPANSFIASALGVLRAGAEVLLVDCDPGTYLIDSDAVERALGPRVRAVMPVHLFGQTSPVEQLAAIVGSVVVIEDAAQSQGATRFGKPAGSLGTIAGTSFYPGKNIGAYGDAGAVLTDDPDLATTVRNLGNWGSPEKYHHPVAGFNSRLDTIQAVILRAKLARLSEWNELRRTAAERYRGLLAGEERVVLPSVAPGNDHIWHLFVVRVPNRNRVVEYMHAHDVGVGVHYPIPMHLQGALSSLGYVAGDFPATERAAEEMLSLPMYPGITLDQQVFVTEKLIEALDHAQPVRG